MLNSTAGKCHTNPGGPLKLNGWYVALAVVGIYIVHHLALIPLPFVSFLWKSCPDLRYQMRWDLACRFSPLNRDRAYVIEALGPPDDSSRPDWLYYRARLVASYSVVQYRIHIQQGKVDFCEWYLY